VSENFTVVGANGFVGARLVQRLRADGHACEEVTHDAPLPSGDAGHLVYCAGLTGGFRSRPLDAVDAHVAALAQVIRNCRFDSLVYLSSTRVYDRCADGVAREDDELRILPSAAEDLYAASKIAGEALALRVGGRVARLSNVYGPGQQAHTFLAVALDQALAGRLVLESALDSARDFVPVDQVVEALVAIALTGAHTIYNVASGELTANSAIADLLAERTGCAVEVRDGAPTVRRPRPDVSRLHELGIHPPRLIDCLTMLLPDRTAP
jgi:nucleoside-diphosphate-sugar epimerase